MEQAIRTRSQHIHKAREEEFKIKTNRITPKAFTLHETGFYKSETPQDKYAKQILRQSNHHQSHRPVQNQKSHDRKNIEEIR